MSDNLATVAKMYEAFGRGDGPGMLACLADDVKWEPFEGSSAQQAGVPGLQARRGKPAAGEFFQLLATFKWHDFRVIALMAGEILRRQVDLTWRHFKALLGVAHRTHRKTHALRGRPFAPHRQHALARLGLERDADHRRPPARPPAHQHRHAVDARLRRHQRRPQLDQRHATRHAARARKFNRIGMRRTQQCDENERRRRDATGQLPGTEDGRHHDSIPGSGQR